MFTVAIVLGFTTAGWVRLFYAPRPNPDPQTGTPYFIPSFSETKGIIRLGSNVPEN